MSRKTIEYTFVLLCGLVQSIFIVNLSLFLHDSLRLAPKNLAAVVSGYFAISMAFSIAVGIISDRIGRHTILMRIIAAIISIGCVGVALSGSRGFAITALLLGLAPAGSLVSVSFAYFGARGDQGSQIVLLRSFISASWVIGPMLGTWIVARSGFLSLFMTIGLLCILLAILSAALPQYEKPGRRDEITPATEGAVLYSLALPLAAIVLLQGAMSISTTILPVVVTGDMSAPRDIVGYAFSLCALLEILFMVLASRWLRRFSCRDIMLSGCLIGGVYYLGMLFVRGPWWLLPLQVFNAAYIAVTIGIGLAWFQAVAPQYPGLATSLFVNAYNVGAVLATMLLGYAVTMSGTYQFGATVALSFIAVGAGLVTLSPTLRKRSLADAAS